jgi:transcriptional regulator with XRE-family HTH domain
MAKSAEVKCVEEKAKNIYYRAREACRMSREDAVEQLGISMTKLGRIERGETAPQAEDVVAMAEAYGDKSLFNYYCSKECEIGFKCRVDEVRPVGLAEATLGIIASVNAFNSWKDKFIEIAEDGSIDPDELEDFKAICKSLKKISALTERLKISVESYTSPSDKKG